MPDTIIGRVYVEDPDDWDLPDKHFYWATESNSQFRLNQETGEITLLEDTKNGTYNLQFRVTEESMLIDSHEVNADVTVKIKNIPDEAITRSGSIRFYGQTAYDFINVPAKV